MMKNGCSQGRCLYVVCAIFFIASLCVFGKGEGKVTIVWSILPRQTLSEFPRETAERAVPHPFELPRPAEDFAVYKGVIVLAVRSNIPWVVTVKLDCRKEQVVPAGTYFLFEKKLLPLGCKSVLLKRGGLGEHRLILEFSVIVPREEITKKILLERTLVFEIFPSASPKQSPGQGGP